MTVNSFPVLVLDKGERWAEHAACRSMPTWLFFPDDERSPERRLLESQAKALCLTCPVLEQCRVQALAAAEPHGVWGGLTAKERAVLRTEGAIVPAPAVVPQQRTR